MKRIPQLGELPATNFGNVTTLTKQLTRRLTERFGPGLSYFRPRRRILPAKKAGAVLLVLLGLSHRPSCQRDRAPMQAPRQIAITEGMFTPGQC